VSTKPQESKTSPTRLNGGPFPHSVPPKGEGDNILDGHYFFPPPLEGEGQGGHTFQSTTMTPQGKRPTGIEMVGCMRSRSITVTSPLTPLVV
jgi:hypothetical protein